MTHPPSHQPEPPSFAEVMEIVQRRRRHRQRVGRAIVVTIAAVGSGIGLTNFQTRGEGRISPGQDQSAAPAGSLAPSATVADVGDEQLAPSCTASVEAGSVSELMEAGFAAFGSVQPASYDDAVSIAEEWNVSPVEAKAIAVLSVGSGRPFDRSLFDAADSNWADGTHEPGELELLANEWELSPMAVKALVFIDTPEINDVLGPCLD